MARRADGAYAPFARKHGGRGAGGGGEVDGCTGQGSEGGGGAGMGACEDRGTEDEVGAGAGEEASSKGDARRAGEGQTSVPHAEA